MARSVEASGEDAAGTADVRDLGVLLDSEREATARPLLEALLTAQCWGTPETQAAAARLLGGHAPWGTDLAPGETFLVGAPSAHQASLFLDWLLGSRDRTLEAIGRPRGMSAPAVGDAMARAGRRMRAVLDQTPPPWPWILAELRRRLGSVTTEELLGGTLERLGAARGSRSAALATWLAGPYAPVRGHLGWLATDPGSVLARSAGAVRTDGGVRPLADVAEELADLGLAPGVLVPWLQELGTTVVHDLVVVTSGALADAVERVLDAHGVPRTVAEIAEDLAAGGRMATEASLAAAARGRRFRTTGEGAVWLAAWGEPGTKAPRRPSARRGGRARSRAAEPVPVEARRRLGTGGGQPARVRLWVRVDEAVLAGEEATVPVELVEGLALDAECRRTFSSRWGPVTLVYEGPQPTRGSLRAVARAAGARPGDTLLLGFSPAGDVAVELRGASPPDPGPPGVVMTADSGAPVPAGGVDAMVRRRGAPAAASGAAQTQTLSPDTTSEGAQ